MVSAYMQLISNSYFFFPLFGVYTLQYHKDLYKETWTGETVILAPGSLKNILCTMIFFQWLIVHLDNFHFGLQEGTKTFLESDCWCYSWPIGSN